MHWNEPSIKYEFFQCLDAFTSDRDIHSTSAVCCVFSLLTLNIRTKFICEPPTCETKEKPNSGECERISLKRELRCREKKRKITHLFFERQTLLFPFCVCSTHISNISECAPNWIWDRTRLPLFVERTWNVEFGSLERQMKRFWKQLN